MADVLLRVHRSYLASLKPSLPMVHALAHITGGGIPGNLNRALPPTADAVVRLDTWPVPNVFAQLGRAGNVAPDEMLRTFNMGVGMIVIADTKDADAIATAAASSGVGTWRLGEVVHGSGQVILT